MAHVEQALGNGLRNIMALRGDELPEMIEQQEQKLANAKEVSFFNVRC
jgi:5,10-methylenetetrahydrofolate reductase